jgi:hypothetical protein
MIAAVLFAASCAQAPALVPAPDARVPALRWTSEAFDLRSERLGETLRVFVGKSPSFERSKQRLPLLVVLDAQYYFDEVLSAVAALADHGQVPELLLVGVASVDRRVDFTPKEIVLPDVGDRARAPTYVDFLEHELVPRLEADLRAGKPRVLLGHSHSALFVLHAVARRPSAFPWGIAADAPTHHVDGLLARDLARLLGQAERPSVRVVAFEAAFPWSDERWEAVRSAARPTDLLARERLPHETHESMVLASAYRGLQALFADASMKRTRELAPLEIDALYRSLAPLYGAELAPTEPVMRRVIEDFLLEGRGKHAGEWLERYVALYGKPRDHEALAARVKTVTAAGEPTETVQGLLALPRATPAEMKDHLGTWTGTTWRGDGPKEPVSVRFTVEDGTVHGAIAHPGEPDIEIEYLRFRADGALEFGFKNGMRPRGLITWSDREPGGPLAGEVGFRGMRFTPPPGESPLRQFFELKRAEPEK